MKYWIEKTLVSGRQDRLDGDRALGKALWSPQRDKRGADIYKNMRDVETGDIVFHLIDNYKISGISVAKSKAIETSGLSGTDWDVAAYLVPLENYIGLNPEILRTHILNPRNKSILDEINKESEVFYNNKLELRQGAYLTPCPKSLLSLISSVYSSLSNNDLPHINKSDLVTIDLSTVTLFENNSFFLATKNSGLSYSDFLITRFTASLLTKPFVILTGLSGSGKTKLAQAFVQWICQDESQYRIIPVGMKPTNLLYP